MEGESDGGEDAGAPEGKTDGLHDYREIQGRNPESRKIEHGSAGSNSGKVPEEDSGQRREPKDEIAEEPRKFEHDNSSLNSDGRSEPSAEPESRSDLERLREDLGEKYPQEEGRKLEERAVPTAVGKPEVEQELDSAVSEDARSELEGCRKEIGEKQEGLGGGPEPNLRTEGPSKASLGKDAGDEEKVNDFGSGSKVPDRGDEIDSPERESEKAVRSDKSAREGDSVHEQTPLAKEVGVGRNQSESVKELADLGENRCGRQRERELRKKRVRDSDNTWDFAHGILTAREDWQGRCDSC